MYWKHKIYIYFICLMMAAQSMHAKGIIESLRSFLSFKIPEDILSSLNANIMGKLTVKNIKFYLPNQVEMDDVSLVDGNGVLVLSSHHIKLKLSLISLLTNNIKIVDAFVDYPFFNYAIIDGVHNVIGSFASPPQVLQKQSQKKSKVRVTIEKVNVKNGRYEMYHDAGVRISAQGIVATGSFWVENGQFGVSAKQVNIAKGTIVTAGMDLPITAMIAKDLWISDREVSTPDLVANYENAKIMGRGTVFIKEERYDISAHIDAPVGTYPKGLRSLPFVVPAFAARVRMIGALTDPDFSADINHQSTDFRGVTIRQGKISTQIH